MIGNMWQEHWERNVKFFSVSCISSKNPSEEMVYIMLGMHVAGRIHQRMNVNMQHERISMWYQTQNIVFVTERIMLGPFLVLELTGRMQGGKQKQCYFC